MAKTWIVADTLLTPLGNTPEKNFDALQKSESAVKQVQFGSIITPLAIVEGFENGLGQSRFDSMCLRVLEDCLSKVELDRSKTLLMLSTTKGNIELLDQEHEEGKCLLTYSANLLKTHFGLKSSLVVSNACISSLVAMIMAERMLSYGEFDNIIVLGADVVTPFVVNGFRSVQAMSHQLCKPFDSNRDGINLGEAAAAVVLTRHPERIGATAEIEFCGGSITNDANHISGPSRTGFELATAITKTLKYANMKTEEVGFISAHGTATVYNDEMEAKAIHHAGMQATPVHSLKGYFGHTLGAAGLVETIMGMQSLRQQKLIVSKGYETIGVTQPLNIITQPEHKKMNTFIKTASGFGGGNAAIAIRIHNEN